MILFLASPVFLQEISHRNGLHLREQFIEPALLGEVKDTVHGQSTNQHRNLLQFLERVVCATGTRRDSNITRVDLLQAIVCDLEFRVCSLYQMLPMCTCRTPLIRTRNFLCHAQDLIVRYFIPHHDTELRPLVQIKNLDHISSHIPRISHTNNIIPIPRDSSFPRSDVDTKGIRSQVRGNVRHAPIIHEETRDNAGVFQRAFLQAGGCIQPELNAGVYGETAVTLGD